MSTTASIPNLASLAGSFEFVISRIFDAPRKLVWQVLTQPEHLIEWWGPAGLHTRIARMDLRPGGMLLYSMQAPDGSQWWGRWTYREIVAPDRLVFVASFTDAAGNPLCRVGDPGRPLEFMTTITLSGTRGKTLLTNRSVSIPAPESNQLAA